MIGFSGRAERQIADLSRHYNRLGRPEARRALLAAIRQATLEIAANPTSGLPAPRPYPGVAQPGVAWMRSGRYWIAYETTDPPLILLVFHDAADIPGRL